MLPEIEVRKILEGHDVRTVAMSGGGWIAGQCAIDGERSGALVAVGTPDSISGSTSTESLLARFRANGPTSSDHPGVGDAAVLSPNGIAVISKGFYVEIVQLGTTRVQLVDLAELVIASL